jgi:hypothetical protein
VQEAAEIPQEVAPRQVHAVYPSAKIDVLPRGLLLHASPPPVAKIGVVVQLPP